jgi:hypothetical protein
MIADIISRIEPVRPGRIARHGVETDKRVEMAGRTDPGVQGLTVGPVGCVGMTTGKANERYNGASDIPRVRVR